MMVHRTNSRGLAASAALFAAAGLAALFAICPAHRGRPLSRPLPDTGRGAYSRASDVSRGPAYLAARPLTERRSGDHNSSLLDSSLRHPPASSVVLRPSSSVIRTRSSVLSPSPATQARLRVAYGRLPLEFEANQGQTASQVKFLCRTGAGTVFLTGDEMAIGLRVGGHRCGGLRYRDERPAVASAGSRRPAAGRLKPAPRATKPGESGSAGRRLAAYGRLPAGHHRQPTAASPPSSILDPPSSNVTLRLLAANPHPQVTGIDELPGKSNYFIGNNPAKWRTNVPHYAKVRCRNVYPGVDVLYYGSQRQIEHDFVVKPGANPSSISLAVAGASGKLSVGKNGGLQIPTAAGRVTLDKPAVYQEIEGKRVPVSGGYVIDGRVSTHSTASTRVAFRVGKYDRQRDLVIDPVLVYSTYLGGLSNDYGYGIAVDRAGAAYVTGETASTDFPTASPLQAVNAGGSFGDAFVSKITPDGSRLVYSTFLGGSDSDSGRGIAVDSAGAVYVTGSTNSSDFPTVSPFQGVRHGNQYYGDAFVSKVSPDGSHLVYSTYLGGSDYEWGSSIAVDEAGAAYVTGITYSADFPTVSPLQPAHRDGSGTGNAFVSKISPDGSHLVYSTYLGGGQADFGAGIAVDGAGAAYVTGYTSSADFPTASPIQATYIGYNDDAFVSKISPDGSHLVYSTYLGGIGNDAGSSIAVDDTGAAYVTGTTASTDFPTALPLQATNAGDYLGDAFVSKISPDGSRLVYSTYLGGSGNDAGYGIAVDGTGAAYVTGATGSLDFPTASPFEGGHAGAGSYGDAFVSKISPDGSHLVYSTFLGGSDDDFGYGIAVDATGAAYVTGGTSSSDFPTTAPLQAAIAGGFYGDAFVSEISAVPPPNVQSFNPVVGPVGTSVVITGSLFTGATKVAFNGTSATFTVASDTQITAIVPAGAMTGPISITGPSGIGTSVQPFTVIYPPAAPTALMAVAGNAQITLTWTAVRSAVSYNIKRSTTPGVESAIQTGVTGTTFTDTGPTNGTTYFYVVSAVNAAGESSNSGEVNATPLAAPNAPTLLTADAGNRQVILTWIAPAVDSTHGPPATYNVKRSTTAGAETTVQTGLTTTSYTDTGLTNGTEYFYVVTATNVGGASPVSSEAFATPLAAPAAPAGLTASPASARIVLTWTAPATDSTHGPAATYTIKRSASAGAETILKVGVTGTSYTDTGLTNGVKAYYVVTAANVGGEGPDSNEVNATPAATTTVTITASPASAAYGQKVTLTAVISTASGAPTGSVTFQDGTVSLGKVALSNGTAALSTTALSAGSHSLTAIYSGDGSFAGSTSAAATVTITYQYPIGISMVSVPYDYSKEGTVAAVLFGLSGVTPAPIAIYDPVKGAYDFYPTLLDGGTQTRPGRAYWVLESAAQPSPAPGAPVASPFTESLSPGWNMIADPFPGALDVSTLQITAGVVVGSAAAGTSLSEASAVTAGLIGGPLWTYDTSSRQYQQTTTLQPYSGCWIYIDPAVSGGKPVSLTFTQPGA